MIQRLIDRVERGGPYSIAHTRNLIIHNKGALIGSSLTYAEWRARKLYMYEEGDSK